MPQKELKEIDRDKTSGVTVKIPGNNLQRLTGYVEGTNLLTALPPCRMASPWTVVIIFNVALVNALHGPSRADMYHVCLAGPRDTAYEGGYFVVDIQLGKSLALDILK